MRIAIFASLFGVEATGLSKAAAEAALHLASTGHKVTVIATDCGYRGQVVSQFLALPSDVRVQIFSATGKLNRRLYRSPALIEWVRDNIGELDLLEMYGIWNYSGMAAAQLFRTAGKPYVLTPQGTMTRYDWRKGGIKRTLFFRLGFDEVWNHADAIRFVSSGEQASSYYPARRRSIVIPNGIDVQPVTTPELRAGARERLGIAPDARVLLFLGRITHQKGVKETLAAFALAASQLPQLRLYLVGPSEGDYGAEVMKTVVTSPFRDRIIATGAVFDDRKNDYFRAADAFITLSHNEGLSVANLEALSHGLPMILTRAGFLEHLEEYGAGIYTKHDPAEAAADIVRLMVNNAGLAVARNRAHLLVQEKFSWTRIIPELVNLYEEISKGQSLVSSAA